MPDCGWLKPHMAFPTPPTSTLSPTQTPRLAWLVGTVVSRKLTPPGSAAFINRQREGLSCAPLALQRQVACSMWSVA